MTAPEGKWRPNTQLVEFTVPVLVIVPWTIHPGCPPGAVASGHVGLSWGSPSGAGGRTPVSVVFVITSAINRSGPYDRGGPGSGEARAPRTPPPMGRAGVLNAVHRVP